MAKIKVKKDCSLPSADVFDKLQHLFESDRDLKKIDPNYSCEFDKNQLNGKVVSKQFKAEMDITESKDGSSVEITVNLPFHLALMKGPIEKALKNKIDKVLG